MDVLYARSWSLVLDLRLLLRTPLHVLRREGTRDVTPLRVAVVGLGYWGPNLVRNLLRARRGARSPTSATSTRLLWRRSTRRYPAIATTTRFDDLLADDALDAVLIATPVSTHHPLASAALQAGKHVFVEKPLAASSAEGARADPARREERARADAGPHVPLQPAGQHDPRRSSKAASSARSTSSRRAA